MLVLPAHYQPSKGVLLLPKEITTAPKTKGSEEPFFPMSSDSVEQSLDGHRKAAYQRQGNCIHVPKEEMNQAQVCTDTTPTTQPT